MAYIITECEYCEGEGIDPYGRGEDCPYCNGTGLEKEPEETSWSH